MELITVAPGHLLAPAPAASALRMFAAACPVTITQAWRSDEQQAVLRAAYLAGRGSFAMPVGHSRHPFGYAVDWKAPAAAWVRTHPDYGWRFTDPSEWWHTEYFAAYDNHLTDSVTAPAPLTPTPQEDNDMARLIRHPNGSIALVGPGPLMTVLHTTTEVDAVRATGQATGDTIQLPDPLIWNTATTVARRAGTYKE